jgi:hypothetical protein
MVEGKLTFTARSLSQRLNEEPGWWRAGHVAAVNVDEIGLHFLGTARIRKVQLEQHEHESVPG